MISSRQIRFVLIGVVNTAFSFGRYLLFVYMGLHFATANLLATLAGILFSFRTQGRFVFSDTRWSRLFRFFPLWVALYGFNVLLIALFSRLELNAYEAGALALLPTVALSYFLQRRFVFEIPSAKSKVNSL